LHFGLEVGFGLRGGGWLDGELGFGRGWFFGDNSRFLDGCLGWNWFSSSDLFGSLYMFSCWGYIVSETAFTIGAAFATGALA
jgi:hypothetical protein